MDFVAYLEAMRFVARQHFLIYSLPYREAMPPSLPPGPSHSHVSDPVPHKTKTSLGNLIGGALPAIPLWIHIAQSKQRGSLTTQRNRRITRAIDSEPLTRGPKSDPPRRRFRQVFLLVESTLSNDSSKAMDQGCGRGGTGLSYSPRVTLRTSPKKALQTISLAQSI